MVTLPWPALDLQGQVSKADRALGRSSCSGRPSWSLRAATHARRLEDSRTRGRIERTGQCSFCVTSRPLNGGHRRPSREWAARTGTVDTGGMPLNGHQSRRHPNSPFRDEPTPVYDVFEVDSRVIHDRHGLGRVLSVNGERMDVRFGAGVVDVDTRSSKVHLL